MAVSPSVINKIKWVLFRKTEPTTTSGILWAKPEGEKFAFYVYDDGTWKSIEDGTGIIMPEISTSISAFTNDAGYLTAVDLSGYSTTEEMNAAIAAAIPTVFGASGNDHKSGLVPDPGITAGTTKYLREDAQWIELATTNDVNNLQPPSGELDPQTWKDEEWAAITDKYPTENSENLVESGGVYKAIDDLRIEVDGGEVLITPTATKEGFVNNGNVAGTDVGYWHSANGWKSYIYNVTGLIGKSLKVAGAIRTQSYSYIFCKNYAIIPNSKTAYNTDPTLWTSNKVSALSGRGVNGNVAYTNNNLNVPEQSIYLIIAEYTGLPASLKRAFVGKQDVLTFDNVPIEDSINPVTSGGIYNVVRNIGVNTEEWALTEKNRITSKVKSKYSHEIVVFGFNTDQHIRHETNRAYYTEPVLRGLRSLRGIADEIPLSLICLAGDAAGYSTETTQEKVDADIQEIINAVDTTKCPVLYITGNHDGGQNITPEWTTTDGRNMFNSALKRNVVRKEIGHFNNRSTNCWFDDEANKIRFIILDHWARSTGPREGAGRTYTAMRDILSDALDDVKLYNSDWGVIFLSHNVLRSVEGNNYDPPASSDWDDTIKPAIDDGLYIIGCFNGHCHYDGNGIKDNTLLICSQTAGIQAAEESFDGITYSHTPNTVTETSFDVFVIDKTDHKIYGYKYGAGMDRLFYYGKDNPRMMLCNLSGTVSSGGNAVSGTVTATHHNTVYRCILDANGAYSFPYLCPECDWVIKIISNDAEIYSETYSATEGVITKNIEINN